MSLTLGVDIGTFESKGVLVDTEGRIHAEARRPHRRMGAVVLRDLVDNDHGDADLADGMGSNAVLTRQRWCYSGSASGP